MDNEQDISDTVDEFVDTLDPHSIEREAERLGISTLELFSRIVEEANTRIRFDEA